MEFAERTHALALLASVVLLGLLFRLAPIFRSDLSFAFHPDDSFEYIELAAGLRSGCGFARLEHGVCQKPEILRTPGYPAFLALLPNLRAILATQAILGILSCLIVVSWLWYYDCRTAAVAASVLAVFDVPSIVMSNSVMSETLFGFVLVGAMVPCVFERMRSSRPFLSAAIAGILGGIAVLIRPIGAILPFLLPIPFLATRAISRRNRIVAAGATLFLAFVIPFLWSVRNYRVAQFAGISTVGAINLYYYRAANAVAREQGVLLEDTQKAFGKQLGVTYDHIYDANVQSDALIKKMNHLSIGILKNRWPEALAMTLQSLIYLAVAPMRSPLARMLGTKGESSGIGLSGGALSFSRIRGALQRTWESPGLTFAVVVEVVLTVAVWMGVLLALVRVPTQLSQYSVPVVFLTATALLLLALAAGGEADVRFRAPISPLLAGVAALGYFPPRSKSAAPTSRRVGTTAVV